MARKIGEAAKTQGIKINYPLVGAAAYAGMMIWHGGISGSAPAKVGEQGHLASLVTPDLAAFLPDLIAYPETVFSFQNIVVFLVLLLSIPLILVWLGRQGKEEIPRLNAAFPAERFSHSEDKTSLANGPTPRFMRTHWDESKILAYGFGLAVLTAFFYNYGAALSSGIVTPEHAQFFNAWIDFYRPWQDFKHTKGSGSGYFWSLRNFDSVSALFWDHGRNAK